MIAAMDVGNVCVHGLQEDLGWSQVGASSLFPAAWILSDTSTKCRCEIVFFAQSRARQHYAACRVSTEIHQLIIHHSTCSRRVRFDVVCRLQHTSDSGGMSCSSSCLASEDRIRKVGKLETASCGSEFDNFGNVVCLLTQVRTTEAHRLPPCVPNALHLFARGSGLDAHI